ncbi:4Fe-4S binding protein [Candidatus Pyrohabitans sp.]
MKIQVINQQQKEFVTLRLQTGGKITSEQLELLAELAEDEARGYVLLTMRKNVELPWIEESRVEKVIRKIAVMTPIEVGSESGDTGIMSCSAHGRCPFEVADVEDAYRSIQDVIRKLDFSLPNKFRITVTGCPNYCTLPFLSDFAVVAQSRPKLSPERCIGCGQCARICRGNAITLERQQVDDKQPIFIDFERCIECAWCIKNCPTGAIEEEETGFTVLLGGRGGPEPRLAEKLISMSSEEEVLEVLVLTLQYYGKLGVGRERFSELLDRTGIEPFKEFLRRIKDD